MNRLWVRLSLSFAAVVIIVMTIIGITTRLALEHNGAISAEAPPEVRAYFQQLRREGGPFDMTYVIIIVSVVAIGAGIWTSKTLSAPLEELEEAAQAIGHQNLSRRVTVRGSGEVRSVASRFNEMAEQLEEAEQLRSTLLSDVAHELRNPLHILQGNLQAMLDDVYPLNKEEIARLSDQTRHLTTLVDDLHELSQAEAHQLRLEMGPTDIAALVKETTAAFQPVAVAQDVALRVELLGTIPALKIDRDRLRQALSNLLSNALRHTPSGGEILVRVQLEKERLCLSVKDTGAGIAPEHLDHVFDRFYRTDDARSRAKGGAGLGLAIVRAIIHEHGGQVSISSPGLGHGSTLTISLPIS